jgi:hypothetical protein
MIKSSQFYKGILAGNNGFFIDKAEIFANPKAYSADYV